MPSRVSFAFGCILIVAVQHADETQIRCYLAKKQLKQLQSQARRAAVRIQAGVSADISVFSFVRLCVPGFADWC